MTIVVEVEAAGTVSILATVVDTTAPLPNNGVPVVSEPPRIEYKLASLYKRILI